MMDFIKQNLMLVALALVSGGMLLWPMLKRGASGVADVSPNDAVLLINREHATVLDVRNANEYAAGHITEALHIPLGELESRLAELAKYKDKPLLVNCQGGVRSTSACGILKNAGFTRIYNLEGGVNAWGQAKLPLIKEL
jgi:rhodanese-related sulfurtransferase